MTGPYGRRRWYRGKLILPMQQDWVSQEQERCLYKLGTLRFTSSQQTEAVGRQEAMTSPITLEGLTPSTLWCLNLTLEEAIYCSEILCLETESQYLRKGRNRDGKITWYVRVFASKMMARTKFIKLASGLHMYTLHRTNWGAPDGTWSLSKYALICLEIWSLYKERGNNLKSNMGTLRYRPQLQIRVKPIETCRCVKNRV